MAAELRRYVENRPIRSRPIPAYQRFWRWCVRNPGLAAAGSTAAAATIALAIVSTLAARTYSDQVRAIKVEQQQTRNAERKATLELGNSLLTEGAALQRSGLVGQRFDSLDRLRHAAQIFGADPESRHRLPEIRNQCIAGLALVDLRVRLERHVGNIRCLCVDARPRAVCDAASPRATSSCAGWTTITRSCGSRFPAKPILDGRSFSPDGGLLVTVDRGPAAMGILTRIWDLERRELLAELESNKYFAFDHDGLYMAFGAPGGGVGVWDRHERRVVRRLPLDFAPYHLAFDPEGRRLAVTNRKIADAARGDPRCENRSGARRLADAGR